MPVNELEILAGHLTVGIARMSVAPGDVVPEIVSIDYDDRDKSFMLVLQKFSSEASPDPVGDGVTP
jgi:hypothetical protein